MKKTIITLLTFGGIASAASIGYNEMTDEQKDGVVGYWADSQTLTSSSDVYKGLSTGTSFTISFDIENINVTATESTIISFGGSHSAAGWDDGKLLVRISDTGSLTLINSHGTSTNWYSEYFDGSTYVDNDPVSAYTSNLGLTAADSLTATTTYTFVSDADSQTFTIYKNGTKIDQWTNWKTDTGLTGVQLGRRWQGGATLGENESVVFDNVTIWNKALSASEISGFVIPEPTTATLSLLALAGLVARRRRK